MIGVERISSFQFCCLIILFELGTAVMVPLGADAKQDAWIAVLVGMLGGLLIFSIYAYLHRHFPRQPLTSYVKQIVGKKIGFVIALLYTLFFIYGAARDLRDGMELLYPTYDETPLLVIGFIIISLVCYSLYTGLEVLSRVGEVYFMLSLFLGVLALLCLYFSDVIDQTKVLPLLEKGWKPVLTAAYGQTIMFPFGELICFTMVLPSLLHPQSGFKIGTICILISGTILAVTVFLEISVLGANKTSTALFPFLRLMQYINIGDFIQRMDAFVLIGLIVNDFFKVSIFAYAAILAFTDMFPIQKHKLALPIGGIILFMSLAIAPNSQSHFAQGRFALKYIFPPFILYIPLLLMVIELIRTRLRKREKAKT
ncbi:spore germination protein [Ectobacillus funiculus]|uniref:GerAB/ArcD/ProY family transporter n=1 Tax=Ectobacillus funiculus TaxID=137993 RepID=UPI00397B235B